jgi:hypothetical protein
LRIGRFKLVEARAENQRLKFQLCSRNRMAEQIALPRLAVTDMSRPRASVTAVKDRIMIQVRGFS